MDILIKDKILIKKQTLKLNPHYRKYLTQFHYDHIIKLTNFLTEYSPSLKERFYYILHNIKTPILCNQCKSKTVILTDRNKLTKYCSPKCSNSNTNKKNKSRQTKLDRYGDPTYTNQNKRNKTNLERYGVTTPSKNEKVKEKTKKTNLERYGFEYGLSNPVIKEKSKQTKLEKYSDENYNNHEKTKKTKLEKYGDENYNNHEKSKQTKLEKYGDENYNNHEKTKKTNLERYDFEYGLSNPVIKEKSKQTKLEKYGDANYNNYEKSKQTKLEKYGDENYNNPSKTIATNLYRYNKHPAQTIEIKEKTKKTNILKYERSTKSQTHIPTDVFELLHNKEWLIFQHHIRKKTLTQIAYELNVDVTTVSNYYKTHNIHVNHYSNQSFKCIQWLKYMEEVDQTALIEEYRIPTTQYKTDGYDPLTNTIYEFYGDFWHGNPEIFNPNNFNKKTNCTYQELYDRTMTRELKLKELGYDVVSIWETEWDEQIKHI